MIVTAVRAFPYRGREIRPGDVLQMDVNEAYLLLRYGFIGPTLQQTYQTRALTAQ